MNTTCFPKLRSDDLTLHKGARTLDDCKCYSTDKYDNTEKLVAEVEVLTCDCLWRIYQREAERIVAPGGKLIADPIARNRRINAAYAALWLEDNRFEWAGLAAFASKQVGCGLLHAATWMEKFTGQQGDLQQARELLPNDLRVQANLIGSQITLEQVKKPIKYVHDMLALGNTALFLDIYPLHMFYKKRGLQAMKKCLRTRRTINNNPKFPVMWPVADKVKFGFPFDEIIPAFNAIESKNIFESVRLLARHEQQNILQPAIYEDPAMQKLLGGNQVLSSLAFVTNISTGLEVPVELTLANQCATLQDGRSIGFSTKATADLSNVAERMPFVMRAANQFHNLLKSDQRPYLEQAIFEISKERAAQ